MQLVSMVNVLKMGDVSQTGSNVILIPTIVATANALITATLGQYVPVSGVGRRSSHFRNRVGHTSAKKINQIHICPLRSWPSWTVDLSIKLEISTQIPFCATLPICTVLQPEKKSYKKLQTPSLNVSILEKKFTTIFKFYSVMKISYSSLLAHFSLKNFLKNM